MINLITRKIFGSRNERILKKLRPAVAVINALEQDVAALTDDALRARTTWLKERLTNGETLDAILPDAFATVREAAKRVLGERHYDVQLLGGIVLHNGMIPEMRTGEGKTLVGTLPVYLNALTGRGVHVVTVNDYLAKRDAEWMGRVYGFLGLSVGIIQGNMPDDQRRAAYACDITYSTNNELGFDYLRDNMKYRADDMVQRPFNFAIIDEVDSILIDEARTPLIISGPAEDGTELYIRVNALVTQLTEADFERDEKTKSVLLTDEGTEKIETLLRDADLLTEGGLYDTVNMPLLHHVNVALRAQQAYARDKEYIVKDDKIILIDEFTGRMMSGRRFSDGLHQALEAKEGVKVQRENQTLASITFQNFFRMYPKIAGMTGTALTEAGEFAEIYNLDVVEIPTHRPVARRDGDDEIYRSEREKFNAIVMLVKDAHARKQPVLVGTTSIEKSEKLSALFTREKIPHSVLNARHHEQEAQIVAQAGRPGAVTVATNMAGRGTDIKLGGNADLLLAAQLKGDETPDIIADLRSKIAAQVTVDKEKVLEAGGLYVIGTERHESRRIDNQLRGRSGRQGDPGASKFFISLEDDLMRIFGAERIDSVLVRLGITEGHAITHPWISTAIERAQKKVESQHFDIRRNLLRFDNVMNDQRKVIYDQRRNLMSAESLSDIVADMIEEVTLLTIERHIPADSYKEKWNLDGLATDLRDMTGRDVPVAQWAGEEGCGEQELADKILGFVTQHWDMKQTDFINSVAYHPTMFGLPEGTTHDFARDFAKTMFHDMERSVVMQMLDKAWKEHLLNLDHLRQGINLRGYGQRDPLNEYKAEAFALFTAMLDDYRADVAKTVLNLNVVSADELARLNAPKRVEVRETRIDPALDQGASDPQNPDQTVVGFPLAPARRTVFDATDPATWGDNVGRNNPCPCGSGKKYKHCHGAVAVLKN